MRFQQVGLFFPLSWVEGVETLIEVVVGGNKKNAGCLVVVQGGLVRSRHFQEKVARDCLRHDGS